VALFAALELLALTSAQAQQAPSGDLREKYETLQAAVSEWTATHRNRFANQANSSFSTSVGAAAAQVGDAYTGEPNLVFTGNLDVFEPDPAEEAEAASSVDEELLRLAQTTGLLRAQLTAWGYPESIYEGVVADFEARSVEQLAAGGPNPIYSDTAMADLIGRIDAMRAANDPRLPSIDYVMQANATFVRPVILRSVPPGGRVWVITQLRFDVCKRTTSNPYDTAGCPQWREADPRNPMYLAGTYAFQVVWVDGRNVRGQRTIYNDRSNDPIVYVLP
jgi:hypothetical protein